MNALGAVYMSGRTPGNSHPRPSERCVAQLALPCERLANDCWKIVVLWRPAERGLDTLRARDERGRIARTAAGNPHLEIGAEHLLDAIDDFQHRDAMAVAAIAGETFATFAQVGERHEMRRDQIGDLNIVADAGAIPGRIIGAEDFKTGA
jgi:hypothetical protein